jgi:hypothetical protein
VTEALLRRAYDAFNARDLDAAEVRHVYELLDGLVVRMDIDP